MAHDVLKNAGFKQCRMYGCYLNYRNSDAPAVHYHIERPAAAWPAYSIYRGDKIPNDPDKEFEELETIRLYRREDTLWEIRRFDDKSFWIAQDNIQLASDESILEGDDPGTGRWPASWPKVCIPTAHKYLEALLMHWVRYKDTEKEMYWFFKLQDIVNCFYDALGSEVLNRMERHCRHLVLSLIDHIDQSDKFVVYQSGVEIRDILFQAEKLLYRRAEGPLLHDPAGVKYAVARLMPGRYPEGNPKCWLTEDPWYYANKEPEPWKDTMSLVDRATDERAHIRSWE